MELFYLKFAFEMPALCRCNLCIKAMECVNSSFGASAILHRRRRRHFMYACKRACFTCVCVVIFDSYSLFASTHEIQARLHFRVQYGTP